MTPFLLRTWSSSAGGKAKGYEVLAPSLSVQNVAQVIHNFLETTTSDGAFLLLSSSPTDPRGVASAVAKIDAAAFSGRICLAMSCDTLKQVDPQVFATGHVGVLLDQVGLDTPPSAFICEGIDAIRFHREFLVRATESIKAAAAMHAMLGLARDLCLATFGPSEDAPARHIEQPSQFDYVLDRSDLSVPLTSIMRNARHFGTR
jgi:hypothetical protein